MLNLQLVVVEFSTRCGFVQRIPASFRLIVNELMTNLNVKLSFVVVSTCFYIKLIRVLPREEADLKNILKGV